jgi:hypothetical protein
VKIRIMGTPAEAASMVDLLTQLSDMSDTGLEILETSRPVPNRGTSKLVRVYVEARLPVLPTSDTGR